MNHALLPLLLLAAPFATAQTAWTELAGSATGGGLSKTPDDNSVEPCVAVSPAGVVYATWTEWPDDMKVHVVKWDAAGNEWIEMGDGLDVAATNSITPLSIIRVGVNEKPVVAWVGGGGIFGGWIYVKRWDGAAWQELDGSASGSGVSADASQLDTRPSMVLDAHDNPVLAWQGQNGFATHVFVRGWTGDHWTDWGSSATISIDEGLTGSFLPSLAVDSAGLPWVAFWGNPGIFNLLGDLRVRRWTGSAWKDIGDAAVTPQQLSPNRPAFALDSTDTPVLCWTYPAKDPVTQKDMRYVLVKRWKNQSWEGLSDNPAVAATSNAVWPTPVMAVTPWNDAVVSWVGDGSVIYVKMLKAGATEWTAIGESYSQGGLSGMSGIPSQQPAIATGLNGLVVAAWYDTLYGTQGNAGEIRLKQATITAFPATWNWQQFKPDGTKLELGQGLVSGSIPMLGVYAVTAGEGTASFEVEVRPAGTPFTGVVTHISPGFTPQGPGKIALKDLADGSYHWQGRIRTVSDKTTPWISFGANAENEADFAIVAPPPPIPESEQVLVGPGGEKSGCLGSAGGIAPLLPAALLLAAALRRPAQRPFRE